jgi:hypothetical protein
LSVDRSAAYSKSTVTMFAVAIFVWAVDFKAEGSGSAAAFQAILLGVYLVVFLSTAVSATKADTGIGSVWVLVLAVAAFLVDSAMIGLSRNQNPYAIFVNLIPPFVYASASVLTYITLSIGKDRLPTILTVLRLACLAYAVGRVGITFALRGIDVAHSRYEVLSGAVTPALGILALALVRRISRLDVVIMIFNLAVTVLSVTRTLFVVLAAQLASVFVARPTGLLKSTTLKGIALLAISGVAIAAVDYAAGTGLIERWAGRLLVGGRMGADPTALTRSAETHFMMESFTASTDTLLFGNGLAAVTSLTGPDARLAAQLVGWASVNIHDVGYGHQSYASILFVAGLLGGGALVFMQVLNALQAIAMIRRLQLAGTAYEDTVAHIGAWGAFIVIGIATYGLLGAVIGDRSTCVWYGVGTGMLYWAREVLQAPKRLPAMVPRVQIPK